MKRPEISQEIKPRQQCDQPYALFSTPRKEQLSTHEKKTVGRGDVEMHGKEINSEKNREENVINKKGTVEASVQQIKHIFHARPCQLTSHNWIILGSWLLTSLAMAGSITAGASRASLDTPLTDSVKIVRWELSVFKFSLSPPRSFLPE